MDSAIENTRNRQLLLNLKADINAGGDFEDNSPFNNQAAAGLEPPAGWSGEAPD